MPLYPALDSDLTTIAGLTATTDNFMQAKSSAWASRTVAEVRSDLGVSLDGWLDKSSETWTYSSVDGVIGVITVPSDYTTVLSVGWRIKWTQTTVKYGIVVAVTATTLTVYTGTGTALTNAAISAMAVSPHKAPLGFDANPANWTQTFTDTSNRTQSSPTQNTWYNIGTLSLDMPIGKWRPSYAGLAVVVQPAGASSAADQLVSLSTSASSESTAAYTARILGSVAVSSGTISNQFQVSLVKALPIISAAAKTTYYLVFKTGQASCTSIALRGDVLETNIRYECAYL